MADFNETWPECAFCKNGPRGPEYRGDAGPAYQSSTYWLFKYSSTRYAHAVCLAIKRGMPAALEAIPEHQRPHFEQRIGEALAVARDALYAKKAVAS